MTKPKVSVVIPSYNRADYIPATLDSVLAQTFSDFELVFIDDGSTDNTEEILKKYIEKDKRVKYFKQENSERAVARSFGIKQSEADLVCLVDSDDLWYANKLEKQVKVMDENPNVVLVYAAVNRIDFDSNPVKAAARQLEGFSGDVFPKLLTRNFIPSVTPMIRRDVLEKVGAQVTEFIPYEDWDFWMRISRHGDFYHIEEPLGDYRLHPGQSVKNVNAEKIEEVTLKVLDANTADADIKQALIDEAYSLAYLRIAYWYILAGKSKKAQARLADSINKSAKRRLDYRWHALNLASYSGNIFNDVLAAFH